MHVQEAHTYGESEQRQTESMSLASMLGISHVSFQAMKEKSSLHKPCHRSKYQPNDYP